MLLEFCSCRQLCATRQLCVLQTAVCPEPAVHPIDSCVLWHSCAPWDKCALQSWAPGDRRAPGRAVCHTVPCEHWDSLQTAVHPADSCVPCGQLCAIEPAVLPAVSPAHSWAAEEPSAHHHHAECQTSGMPVKMLARGFSTSFLAEWACLGSTHDVRAQDINKTSSVWGK